MNENKNAICMDIEGQFSLADSANSMGTSEDFALADNESAVLQSIYMENFYWNETKGKGTKAFNIKLTSSTPKRPGSIDGECFIILSITLPKCYPEKPPKMRVSGSAGVGVSFLDDVRQLMNEKIALLMGQEMIYDICESVQVTWKAKRFLLIV